LRTWKATAYKLAVHPDGITLAATNYSSGGLLLYDVNTGKLLREMKGQQYVYDLDFSPDGDLLVACGLEGVEFWEVASGKLLRVIEGSYDHVTFDPDGRLLAISLGDGRIQVWGLPAE